KPRGFLAEHAVLVGVEDRLIERHPAERGARFDDFVETAVFALAQSDRFLGAQIMAKNFGEQLPAAAYFLGEALTHDVAESISKAYSQLLFFAQGEQPEDTIDRLAGIDGVQRAEDKVPGFGSHQCYFNRCAVAHFTDTHGFG